MLLSIYLFGGDEEAGSELQTELNQTRTRIQELKQLQQECECDEQVRNMFQEQIQNMELEQERLEALAQNEIQNKGLLGWLFK